MRSYSLLYLDVGYLLASSATLVTGTSLRGGINVNHARLVASLVERAEEFAGTPVLRAHWYDSANNGVPDTQQERIGVLPRVKLRLGRFGVDGQQKGVDLRIGLDLVSHARNQTSDCFFLLSGDDDLTEAVEEAQALGVRVVLLAVPNRAGEPHGVSRHLRRAADDLVVLDRELIDAAVIRVEAGSEPSPAESAGTAGAAGAVGAVVETPPQEDPADPTDPTADEPAARGAAPTPAMLAKPAAVPRRPAGQAGPSGTAATSPVRQAAAPGSTLAYSGSGEGPGQIFPGYQNPEAYAEEIATVAARVVDSYRTSSPEALIALDRVRPSVPRDIDRALLLDLSQVLGIYDLSDPIRFELRAAFWQEVDRIA